MADIPGEGVGVVMLKRLSEAERDGNIIYGIIRGSALESRRQDQWLHRAAIHRLRADVIRQALVRCRA